MICRALGLFVHAVGGLAPLTFSHLKHIEETIIKTAFGLATPTLLVGLLSKHNKRSSDDL